jgi:hypothetical protein
VHLNNLKKTTFELDKQELKNYVGKVIDELENNKKAKVK